MSFVRKDIIKVGWFFTVAFIVLGGLFYAGAAVPTLYAGGDTAPMTGYAWSDNIGWVSFNCSNTSSCGTINYGVSVDENNGKLSGYAWSDNIGWISFNENELSGCPQGSCKAKLNNNKLEGWAKALAGDTSNDGWDGWISLDKKSGPNDYGVELAGGAFGGYAWGGGVVGWLQFNPSFGGVFLATKTPTVDVSGSPLSVSPGGTSTITWTSINTSSCTGTGGTADWPGAKTTSGSQVVGPINSTTTYTLSCSGIYGTVEDSVTINILPPDFSLTRANNLTIDFIGEEGATSDETTITIIPQNGFSSTVTLSASPATIDGESVTYNFSDTTLTSSEYSTGSTFSVTIPNPITENTYTITVTGQNGSLIRTVDVGLEANTFEPGYEEF